MKPSAELSVCHGSRQGWGGLARTATRLRILGATVGLAFLMTSHASAQTTTTSTANAPITITVSSSGASPRASSTTATTTTSGQRPGATSAGTSGQTAVITRTWQVALLFIAIVVLALVGFGLTLYDRVTANRWRVTGYSTILQKLLDSAREGPLSQEEIVAFERAARQSPAGTTGLTRTLLALSLLALVGIALVALLVGNSGAAGDVVKTTIAALTAALTTVLGFYFGAKTASDAQTGGTTHVSSGGAPSAGSGKPPSQDGDATPPGGGPSAKSGATALPPATGGTPAAAGGAAPGPDTPASQHTAPPPANSAPTGPPQAPETPGA